jgi:putative oxygen-independent coproporphyrinogen III oxidase
VSKEDFAGRAGGRFFVRVPRPPLKLPCPPPLRGWRRGLGGGRQGPLTRKPLASSPKTPGLYVHVPFCRGKCAYCDFYSITALSMTPAYLEALEAEATLYQDQFATFDSIYLGGGTPSLLPGEQLTALMACLRRHFHFAPDTEVTLEANPDDLTPEKLALFRDLGVNRLSLGVQSFDDAELRFLGRRHTARQAEQALKLARAAGFKNLGLDLIYALPGQEEGAWLNNLKEALKFQPEHLSCYQLTLSPETPLGRRQAQGKLDLLGEEAERRLFLLTSRFLEEQGYLHYEVSNFAREESLTCRHNLKYWQHAPYLGLGPAAHSYHNGRRWWNHASLREYCRALKSGAAPVAGQECLTPEQLELEALSLGLRTREGLILTALHHLGLHPPALARLKAAGLLRVHQGRLRPTREGLVLADRLPLWLLG